jgi:pyruvate,water dikinase
MGSDVAVAVRSSSVREDSAQASFAGQQATVLNVSGPSALLEAVREVWASVFDASAVLYRSRLDETSTLPTMAVVVQRMVDAEVAGVLFTRNPIDDRADEALICAAYGLGETVVGGGETDTFYVDRRSGQLLRENIGDKRVMLRAVSARGVEAVAGPDCHSN